MNTRNLLLTFLSLCCSLTLLGCGNGHTGTYRSSGNGQVTVTFQDDGTFLTAGMATATPPSGTYTLSGDSVTARLSGCENPAVPGPCASTGTFRHDTVQFDSGFLLGSTFVRD